MSCARGSLTGSSMISLAHHGPQVPTAGSWMGSWRFLTALCLLLPVPGPGHGPSTRKETQQKLKQFQPHLQPHSF